MLRFLSNDANQIACEDLAHFTHDPWSLYRFFNKHHKTQYDLTDRIVLYTSRHIPDELWRHLYEGANLIDISNYLIWIYHPSDLSEHSILQATRWSNDPIPFRTKIIKMETTDPLDSSYFVPDTICPLPWTHLEIRNQGQISPCCVHLGSIGHISQIDLPQAFVHDKMLSMRREFLSGEKPPGCQVCWKNEDSGLTSNRQRHLFFLKKDLVLRYLESPALSSLDIKPGNTCNFKCRICNPTSSSLFAQETAKVHNITIKNTNWAENDEKIFQFILAGAADLVNIDMYGGEPFLIKNLTHLIKQLVHGGHSSKIRLHYNSNGSIYPVDLVKLWQHFQSVDLHFSIDDIGERFELQRGGKWKEVESNIIKIKSLISDNVKISIMPVISTMNVFYIHELLDWAQQLDLPVNEIYLQEPREFSMHFMTLAAKQAVIKKYQNQSHPILLAITKSLEDSIALFTDGSDFIAKTRYFDQIRNQDFSHAHPEISQLMGFDRIVDKEL